MSSIDFLPTQYHQRHARRRAQPWRVVVMAAFVALLSGAAASQYMDKRRAEKKLANIVPQYDLAVSQNKQLAEVQARLKKDQGKAGLYTYLRHPWPKTQLMAAVIGPLPEKITLDRLHVARQAVQKERSMRRRSRAERSAEDEEIAKLSPVARDLKRFRDEFDNAETVVRISGTTRDSSLLHGYLGELGTSILFSKAELDSIESVDSKSAGQLQFLATLVVRPGYGQPNGPEGRKRSSAKDNNNRQEQ